MHGSSLALRLAVLTSSFLIQLVYPLPLAVFNELARGGERGDYWQCAHVCTADHPHALHDKSIIV